jgi:hypothetical protein
MLSSDGDLMAERITTAWPAELDALLPAEAERQWERALQRLV